MIGESDGHEPRPALLELVDDMRKEAKESGEDYVGAMLERDAQASTTLPCGCVKVDDTYRLCTAHGEVSNTELATMFSSPHETLQDNTPADDREAVARIIFLMGID